MFKVAHHILPGHGEFFDHPFNHGIASRSTHRKDNLAVGDLDLDLVSLAFTGDIHPAPPLRAHLENHPLYSDGLADIVSGPVQDIGYGSGFTFEYWTGPSGTGAELGEAMAAVWLGDLNVNTNIGKIVYSAFRPTIIERTSTPFSCGNGNSATPADWPKGLLLSSISAGGYACNIEDRTFAELYSGMAAETDKQKRLDLARQYYDHLHETMLIVGVVESPAGPLLDPEKVIEWHMHPEGKGTPVQGVNNLEYIRLAP